jgi:hypothetical protein
VWTETVRDDDEEDIKRLRGSLCFDSADEEEEDEGRTGGT